MTRTTTTLFLAILCLLLLLFYCQAATLRYLQFQLDCLAEDVSLLYWENGRLHDVVTWLIEEWENEERQAILELRDFLLGVDVGEFEATAYTLQCGSGDGYTATMTRPEAGRTIAVDPRVIPLGSRVLIPGRGIYRAEDTGGAIKGNRLDIYMGDGQAAWVEAMQFGRQRVKAVVLP